MSWNTSFKERPQSGTNGFAQDHEISSDLIVVFTIYKVSEMVLSQRENENPTFLQNVICFRVSLCEI